MKKDFYLKKIDTRGPITVWIVDGQKIRTKVEREFTNFGQHYRFSCIPENEFWLDKEAKPNERRFFIDHLLIEWLAMREGLSYRKAIAIAAQKETAERNKTDDLKKVTVKKGKLDPKKAHVRLIRELIWGKEKIKVWIVNGRLIRSGWYVDFTEGGHDFVYKFVPKNEVWIDDDLFARERPYVLLHELNERLLMSKGMTYPAAHKRSSKIEWEARKDERVLIESLRGLGWASTGSA